MTEFIDVLNYIGDNATETECKELFNHANARIKALRARAGAANAANLTVGDIVCLTGLSPKYLNGCVGEVTNLSPGKAGTSVTVKLDITRFENQRAISGRGPIVRIPASCVKATKAVMGS